MPRLTSKVFVDLAIWMTGFGLAIGLVFPPFFLLLGLPADRILTQLFFASTLTAGLVVGAVNFGPARLVVGRRLRLLADRMSTVKERLGRATGCCAPSPARAAVSSGRGTSSFATAARSSWSCCRVPVRTT